jgi:hypothetical protein
MGCDEFKISMIDTLLNSHQFGAINALKASTHHLLGALTVSKSLSFRLTAGPNGQKSTSALSAQQSVKRLVRKPAKNKCATNAH